MQLLIENCLNNETENKKLKNNEEIEINVAKFKEIFEKKREEKKFKLDDLSYEEKTLQFSGDDENINVHLNNDKICTFSSNQVQLTYQNTGEGKGKIILKNDHTTETYSLDTQAQTIIESCFDETEKHKFNNGVQINAEKFKKIFEKTREKKEYKIKALTLYERSFLEPPALQLCMACENSHEWLNLDITDTKVFAQSTFCRKFKVTLTYQKATKEEKGKIIVKYNNESTGYTNESTSYTIDSETQKLIEENFFDEEDREKLTKNKTIEIDIPKFKNLIQAFISKNEKEQETEEKSLELCEADWERIECENRYQTMQSLKFSDGHSSEQFILKDDTIYNYRYGYDDEPSRLIPVEFKYLKRKDKTGQITISTNGYTHLPIDKNTQNIIESCFDEEERKWLDAGEVIRIDHEKFEKIFQKKREGKITTSSMPFSQNTVMNLEEDKIYKQNQEQQNQILEELYNKKSQQAVQKTKTKNKNKKNTLFNNKNKIIKQDTKISAENLQKQQLQQNDCH